MVIRCLRELLDDSGWAEMPKASMAALMGTCEMGLSARTEGVFMMGNEEEGAGERGIMLGSSEARPDIIE